PLAATNVSLPSALDARPGAWKFGFGTPEPTVRWKRAGLPGSWRTLLCVRPVLRPRRDRCPLALTGHRRGPRYLDYGGSRDNMHFGAQSLGIRTRCLRFAGWVAPPPRKTRFRLLARLCRMGLVYPQGSNERFQICILHLILLPQALPGATGMAFSG